MASAFSATIDFSGIMKDMDGEPIDFDGKPLSHQRAAVASLLFRFPEDNNRSVTEIAERGWLAERLHKNPIIDLTEEEFRSIKECLKMWSPMIAARMLDFLKDEEKKAADKKAAAAKKSK